jgi:hypothetical protein
MTPVPPSPHFFPFLGGAAASGLHMTPYSPQAGHFFGLQRVSMLLPHFSQVKVAIDLPPIDEMSLKFKVQGSRFKVQSQSQSQSQVQGQGQGRGSKREKPLTLNFGL